MANLRSISRYLEYEIVLAMISLTKCFPSSEKSGENSSGKSGTFGGQRWCRRVCWIGCVPTEVLIQILREKMLESSKNSSRTLGLDACHGNKRGFTSKMKSLKLVGRQEVNALQHLVSQLNFGEVFAFFVPKVIRNDPTSANQLVALDTLPDAPTGSSPFGYFP